MCGIAGSIDLTSSTSEERLDEIASGMAEALRHRGPDALDTWVDPAVGLALGHSRLAIIDLSDDGREPMVSADGRYVLVFNGEIYNHRELRSRLVVEGVSFRGQCDAETLLEAISAWGLKAAVQRSDGMFAFAVHDRRRRILSLVRDRLGEKPLYYGWSGQHFIFGSELKALRRHPAFERELDREALVLFMRHTQVPSPHSIYRGIHKLPPATILAIDVDGSKMDEEPEPYWSLLEVARSGLQHPLDLGPKEAADELESLLLSTVSSRMIADVPLGAFLSGGIDSSTVVAMMQVASDGRARTFTIGFPDQGFDEAGYAASVASCLGTEHTELYVTADEARAVIPELPTIYDEPFADSSQIPTALVAGLARQDVKVALSGDGGDEVFGGYVRYQFGEDVWGRFERFPSPVRHLSSRALTSLSPASWDRLLRPLGPVLPRRLRQAHAGDKLHKLASVLRMDRPEMMFQGLVSFWDEPAALVLGASEPSTLITDPQRWGELDDFVDWMMYADSTTYLPDDILTKVDRASMSRSLEVRVPFLAPKVVEFAWRLPRHFKVRHGQGKWLLRQVLHRHVPPNLVERPKQGFGVPIGAWLRGPLQDWAEDLLHPRRLADQAIFDPAPLRRVWQEHLSGIRDWDHHLWSVLMFQAWWDEQRRVA